MAEGRPISYLREINKTRFFNHFGSLISGFGRAAVRKVEKFCKSYIIADKTDGGFELDRAKVCKVIIDYPGVAVALFLLFMIIMKPAIVEDLISVMDNSTRTNDIASYGGLPNLSDGQFKDPMLAIEDYYNWLTAHGPSGSGPGNKTFLPGLLYLSFEKMGIY
jgi:hypothetical protein